MKASQTKWDVVVAGGGPAGSTTGALLAQQGLKVLLVEKSAFPRFHIGESLLPGSWPLWNKLGIDMDASGQLIKQGAMFNFFKQREFFYTLAMEAPEYFPDNGDKLYTFQVVRSEYDQMLLDNARRLGVEVLQPCVVEQVVFEGTQATGAVIADADGDRFAVEARVVVDATGRDSLLARKLGLRHPDPKLNKISYFTHFRGAYRARPNELPIWILTFEGGWAWYISLRHDLTSVGVVVDTDYARTRAGRDLNLFFRETLAKAPYLEEWLADAEQASQLHAISALSYLTDRFVGDGWMLVGDAAMFVDPIFSSGVHLAMKCGDLASRGIAHAFEVGDFSAENLGEYERKLQVPMQIIFPMIYLWYDHLANRNRSTDLFAKAEQSPLLRKRINAILGGAYDEIGWNPVTLMARRAGSH